jgi:hypothetical protein
MGLILRMILQKIDNKNNLFKIIYKIIILNPKLLNKINNHHILLHNSKIKIMITLIFLLLTQNKE